MKRVIKIFIGLLIIAFLLIIYMDHNDKAYINKLKNKTDIKEINYINYYNNYYIVTDDNYIYLLDNKYKELLREDIILIHKNTNNYDIIYDSKFMYLNSKIKDNTLIYQYYDIHSYELIKEVLVGGKNE